jgi:hypothetical protein
MECRERLLYVVTPKQTVSCSLGAPRFCRWKASWRREANSPYREDSAENRFWLKIKNRGFRRKEPLEFREIKPR